MVFYHEERKDMKIFSVDRPEDRDLHLLHFSMVKKIPWTSPWTRTFNSFMLFMVKKIRRTSPLNDPIQFVHPPRKQRPCIAFQQPLLR